MKIAMDEGHKERNQSYSVEFLKNKMVGQVYLCTLFQKDYIFIHLTCYFRIYLRLVNEIWTASSPHSSLNMDSFARLM